ncbi:hypothetical protein RchiOBHm_Chr1g0375651 [Rosa chinensis]|uniref:Uncharacterized protein n=1 Tax=Rosa chinensis TaxID=74649 RepID=A0A2P6SML4_ROSCH|nr:hypothetical protein RchiOBHm_Chr1g0375651 [Rosa chinensis]
MNILNMRTSLRHLYQAKMEELHAERHHIVTEFIHWNEEAITRFTTLFSSHPANLAANAKAVFTSLLEFTSLLDQVTQYLTEGLEQAKDKPD